MARSGRQLLLLIVLIAAGCSTSSTVRPLPTWSAAVKVERRNEPVIVIDHEASFETQVPAFVPYAVLDSWGQIPHSTRRRRIVEMAERARADYVYVRNTGAHETGSTTHVYWGFGVSTSQAETTQMSTGVCYRAAPATLGFHAKDDGTVTVRAFDSPLRAIGCQEGDTILSVNGIPWDEYRSFLLTLTPGEGCEVIWMRPGEGRMAGWAFPVENLLAAPGVRPPRAGPEL